ncbi:hypothetical protein P171DRAFT_456798 [Karstenula rhodostoma CBS 690.94]|uniref:NAD dependent epimerase/dehydratase n=1 Tax=Karstenula rhodostoma CBS 690.94 TaxID=1392251 RepID=A0A9P4PBD2_9PLEO|nr:hypothetical protein P171DRAFT_456798 [Karstenula rhodostoma CBS 690.94]
MNCPYQLSETLTLQPCNKANSPCLMELFRLRTTPTPVYNGAQPSVPKPDTELQVIGAGLPCTGITSFSGALRILLRDPVYGHRSMRRKTSLDTAVNTLLVESLAGYAAVTEMAAAGLVKDVLELYPDAKVICTVRDPDAVANAATLWFLGVLLLPHPRMRHFPSYIDILRKQCVRLYGEHDPVKTVPAERLVFFTFRKEVPSVPFTNINDENVVDGLVEEMVKEGLTKRALVLVTIGVGVVLLLMMRKVN